jgi:sugar phosphate isomerase/epimerase
MKLKTFRHLWGVTLPFEYAFPRIKDQGYNGIEYKGVNVAGDSSFKALLGEYGFEFITQIHTEGDSVDEHYASFKKLIQASLPLNPILINSQSGKDNWTFDQKKEFVERALAYEQQIGIPVAHETHRGRITYNPWDTRDLIMTFSELKLCCDFSHWVCVCERIIHSEIEIIKLCAERCIHIHARVGYEQGPQVPDPAAPEYEMHLKAHEQWWDMIWHKQAGKGFEQTTLTPEFGPSGYHHTLPYTNVPVSDLWKICDWMQQRQIARFNQTVI